MKRTSNESAFVRVALVPVAIVLAAACGEDVAPQPALIRPVRYTTVTGGDAERIRKVSGVAEAGVETQLSFRVAGIVTEVPIKVGDTVKKGQLIAQLDATDLRIQVQEAGAGLAQARAQERGDAAGYKRVRALYESQNASRQELDRARAQADGSRLQARSLAQRLQLARRQVEYARLTAPLAGAISRVDIERNENISTGQMVAVLQSGDELKVKVTVPASMITHISQGEDVKVLFPNITGREFSGSVVEVGVAAEGSTTYPVKIKLDSPEKSIRPGMAADVEFVLASDTSGPQFVLPTTAVGEDRQGRFVYKLKADGQGFGTVHRQTVTVGGLGATGLEILKGVKEGDQVVTAGVSRISDGLRVRVPPRVASKTSRDQPDGLTAQQPDSDSKAATKRP